MQQTLLALAALFAFSIFAFSRQRTDAALEHRAIQAEIEAAATDLAQTVMHEVLALAWDEEAVGPSGVREKPPTSGIGRDAGEVSLSSYDDVDDYHGLSQTRLVGVSGGDLPFLVRVEVDFVKDRDPTEASKKATLTKRVRVHVEDVLPKGRTAPARVDLQRVVTSVGHSVGRR